MLLETIVPEFVRDLCYSQGISGAIATLKLMGDSAEAKAMYGAYAALLTAWAADLGVT